LLDPILRLGTAESLSTDADRATPEHLAPNRTRRDLWREA
jgi:hypothetical protein